MGRCHVEIHKNLLPKLQEAPYDKYLTILSYSEIDDNIYIAHIDSHLLPNDTINDTQELVIKGDEIYFKPWRDV